MKSSIKLATVYSYYPKLPGGADPFSSDFGKDAPSRFVGGNLEKMLGFLEEAGRNNADLVCTHEDFLGMGYYLRYLDEPGIFAKLAEEIPGPAIARMAEIAGKYNMYIVPNLYEKDGGKIYNTSVLIGRNGEISGKYRKVHLPAVEKWMVAGGNEFPVFDTDIGKIGFAICYDILFPEHCRAVALNGADMIIHQTLGWGIDRHDVGESLVRVRAAENSVYLVVCKEITPGSPAKNCIVDNYGSIVVQEQGLEEKIVTAVITPDFDKVSGHFEAFFSGVDSARARLALERMPLYYSVLTGNSSPLLEQYGNKELSASPERIREIYGLWKDHLADLKSGRPVKLKYHWNR